MKYSKIIILAESVKSLSEVQQPKVVSEADGFEIVTAALIGTAQNRFSFSSAFVSIFKEDIAAGNGSRGR